MDLTEHRVTENLHSDIVIIGGGGSGLMAAARAREAGAKDVIVLEKWARPGGNAWLAVCMFGLNSPKLKQLGMEASVDETFRKIMGAGEWTIDPKVIRAYLEKTGEVTGWLENKGLSYDVGGFAFTRDRSIVLQMPSRQKGFKGKDPSMGPGFIGSTIIQILLRECKRLGIKLLTKTRAEKILTDREGNAMGVLASAPDKELKIDSKCVVISAGGFGANEEMMRRYFPEYYVTDGPINRLCRASSTGDGIAMAEELGAAIGDDLVSGVIGPAHHPWKYSVHISLLRPECIWVNKEGKRFVPEDEGFVTNALNRQPGSVMYALIDSNTKAYIKDNPGEIQKAMNGLDWLDTLDDDLQKEGAKGKKVRISHSLDEIAKFVGAPLDNLEQTVGRYNSFCDKGRDEDFTKDKQFLFPFCKPPYYAILGLRFCHGTQGGIRINEHMEVISRHGRPIKGLYASGDNTSGWVTEWHLPGTTMAWCCFSGFTAGENAARYMLGQREKN